MGEILLETLRDRLGGAAPVDAVLTARASLVRVDGDKVTVPAPVRVHIRDGVPAAPVVLQASGPDWYWTLTLQFANISRPLVRHVIVPEGQVEWAALVDIDPATYQPVDPTPTLLETIDRQVAAYLVENPAASPAEIAAAVDAYFAENPVEGVTQAELDAAVAGLARSADLAEVATSGAYTDLDGLPVLDFAPTVHTHEIGDVTGLEDALANAGGGGSTGWVEMPVPAETLGTGTLRWYVRRDGAIVHLKIQVNGTPTGISLGLIPDGYKMTTGQFPPNDDMAFPLIRGGTTTTVNMLRVQYGNQATILTQPTTNGSCMVSWPTDDPWPT